jgi:hypothetical protein
MAITSSAGLGGDIPQMNRGPEGPGIRPLFHSVRDIALVLDKTLQSGFGVLRAGTMLSRNIVTGKLLPYVTDDHMDGNVARSYAVSDVASGATSIALRKEDSYKMAVGDSLILVRDNAGTPEYHDGGAITAIDRDTSPVLATVTFTTAAPNANFTAANGVNCYVKSGESGKFSTCSYVLDKDVDTGYGADAKGANTSVVLNNAILYLATLVNYDASALSDLGAVEDGRFLILK